MAHSMGMDGRIDWANHAKALGDLSPTHLTRLRDLLRPLTDAELPQRPLDAELPQQRLAPTEGRDT